MFLAAVCWDVRMRSQPCPQKPCRLAEAPAGGWGAGDGEVMRTEEGSAGFSSLAPNWLHLGGFAQ